MARDGLKSVFRVESGEAVAVNGFTMERWDKVQVKYRLLMFGTVSVTECLGPVLQNCNLASQSSLKSVPFGPVPAGKHVFMLEHKPTRQAMALAVPTHTKSETEAG
jgi:hypothetical protein